MPEDLPEDANQKAYRWAMRGLYLFAFGLNAWAMWDGLKQSPEGSAIEAKAQSLKNKIMAPWVERSVFKKHANQVIYEATTVVEDAAKDG